jgi:TfoX/Sxy family transcriptional regulator of competence genes
VIKTFAEVVTAIDKEKGVSRGRMFGSEGLKIGKQVFAMEVRGRLVVKLSVARADELRRKGVAEAFDPGHGRPMKQWVAVSPKAKRTGSRFRGRR